MSHIPSRYDPNGPKLHLIFMCMSRTVLVSQESCFLPLVLVLLSRKVQIDIRWILVASLERLVWSRVRVRRHNGSSIYITLYYLVSAGSEKYSILI